jgi:hypothetical protein
LLKIYGLNKILYHNNYINTKTAQLLLEVSSNFLFAAIVQEKEITSAAAYENSNLTTLTNLLNEDAFFKPPFNKIDVVYNYPEIELVPASIFKASNINEYTTVLHPPVYETITLHNLHYDTQIQCVYTIPVQLRTILQHKFSSINEHHTSHLLLSKPSTTNNELVVVINPKSILCKLVKADRVVFLKQIQHTSAADIVFTLLNICKQHQVLNEKPKISLSGFITKDGDVVTQITKYFETVELDNTVDTFSIDSSLKTHPIHYFSNLSQMLQCV